MIYYINILKESEQKTFVPEDVDTSKPDDFDWEGVKLPEIPDTGSPQEDISVNKNYIYKPTTPPWLKDRPVQPTERWPRHLRRSWKIFE